MDAAVSLFVVLVALGMAGFVAALSWGLYLKPKLRRRYERNHHREKFRQRTAATPSR